MADVPTGCLKDLLFAGRRKLFAGYGAIVEIGMGHIVAIEVAGAADLFSAKVLCLGIFRALALKEADTGLQSRTQHCNLTRVERRKGRIICMCPEHLGG